ALTRGDVQDYGFLFWAVNPSIMLPGGEFEKQMSELVRKVKATPRQPGVDEIRIPSERAYRERERRLKEGIVIERTVCSRIFCAFVAHIDDVTPNRGTAIPEPTSGTQYAITVIGSTLNYSASLDVFPLDTADGAGQVASDAVYSGLSIPSGATLHAAALDSPVRIAVLGDAQVHGTFDFGGDAVGPGPGGHAGGLPPSGDGQGPTPGLGSTVAGGGGGFDLAGGDGAVGGGTGGVAAMDMGVGRLQGGSGGGAGGGGAGGAGGGALALLVLGTAEFTGAQLVARGGAGAGAGGGGAGGTVVLGGSPATGAFTVDARGGAGGTLGGASGGAGSPGRVRFEGAVASVTVAGGARRDGVRWDLAAYEPIVRLAALTLRGFAMPGTHVRVQNEIARTVSLRTDTTAASDGTWTATVNLSPGASAFIAYDATDAVSPVPSLSGTSVVVRGDAGARQVYAGALDVVYVPM
ncbi:MAG: Ldh family oxidoreductase, partial [Deltaproteobacteria bacterium]